MVLSSLRSRLVLLVFLALLPAVAVLVWTLRSQRAVFLDAVASNAELTAHELAQLHAQELGEARGLLTGLADVPSVHERDGEACGALFRDIIGHSTGYANLGAIAPDGTVFCSAVPLAGVVSLADRNYFRDALAGGAFAVGEYQVGRITGRPSLNVGYPARGAGGVVDAVVFAALELGPLGRGLGGSSLPDGAVLTLLDRRGVVLARRPEEGSLVGTSLAGDPAYAALLVDRRGAIYANSASGEPRLYAMAPLGGDGRDDAFVAVELPRAAALAATDETFRLGMLVTALVAVTALAVAWWVGDLLFVRRVRALSALAGRLAGGDLGSRSGAAPRHDEIGQLEGAFDEMADALDRLTRRNRQILAAAVEGIMSIDTEGRILSANPAAIAMIGRDFVAIEGRVLHDVVHGHTHARAACPLHQVADQRRTMSQAEDIFERADGTPLPVHVVGSPVREGGEVKGAVLFFADQRQRAALEEQLRQAQKMEVVGRLAGGVAHDFNNLLTAILGYGEILRDQLGPGRSPRELDEMIKGAHRAAALTRQLLTFSRREPYAPRVLDPNALVLGMEKLLRRVIGEDVTLTIDLGGHVGNIRMDASGFEQVILNLAVNARDAMPRGGQLTITTRAGADNLVEIVVADSGPGIDEATAARIFEPFFTTKATGTGLGLAIVRDIVEGAGGHIRLASPPGAGATFGVQLPRTSEALEPTSELPAGLGAGSGTVLLVEDDALVRSFARRALEAGGYDVVEAVDADDAEACADAFIGTIHLLLSDIVLPGRSGPELAARLARTRPTLRVLFMSGYAPGGGASVPEGATVVQKPFSGRVLAARVRETLDR